MFNGVSISFLKNVLAVFDLIFVTVIQLKKNYMKMIKAITILAVVQQAGLITQKEKSH